MIITMQDGKTQEYDNHFIITDKLNCVHCNSPYYHFNFNCDWLKNEYFSSDEPVKALTIKDAKAKGLVACMDCDRDLYLFNHGRQGEIR